MPGATIGKQFNPLPEVLWDGRISILKVGSEYRIQYQYESGIPAIDDLVRARLHELVKSFGPSGPGKEK